MPTPTHILFIIPGGASSKLKDPQSGHMVWGDYAAIAKRVLQDGSAQPWLHDFTYPHKLQPAGIMENKGSGFFRFVEEFGRLTRTLRRWGYWVVHLHSADDRVLAAVSGERKVAYTFSYDFRQDHDKSADELAVAIDRCQMHHPGAQVWLLAHSAGGVVARRYIQKTGEGHPVRRLILMGSPRRGAPYAMHLAFDGPLHLISRWLSKVFGLQPLGCDLVRSFPGLYQWIPCDAGFLTVQGSGRQNPFDHGPAWLDDRKHVGHLMAARRFIDELGTATGVPDTFCFIGVDRKTITHGQVAVAQGKWTGIGWVKTTEGDDTIPESSASDPSCSLDHEFRIKHSNIYAHRDLLPRLRKDLGPNPYTGPMLGMRAPELRIVFQAEQDYYSPGEEIPLGATVQMREDRSPVRDAQIAVQLEWEGGLLGLAVAEPPTRPARVSLTPSRETEGEYEGRLTAPQAEGYYRLKATVRTPDREDVELDDLIAIESEEEPGWVRELMA